ncbi:MAG: sulfur globule protein CV1, partial [Sedimenticola sp.]|nr:sulfur globule protein CV1 [Sedimenticola sp.]
MKMTKLIAAIALTTVTMTASAWWGGNPWNGNGLGDGYGDGSGDFNMSFSGRSNLRGYGNGYGYNNPYYGGYGAPYGYGAQPYGYGPAPVAPYGAMSEEQQKAMEAHHQAMMEA